MMCAVVRESGAGSGIGGRPRDTGQSSVVLGAPGALKIFRIRRCPGEGRCPGDVREAAESGAGRDQSGAGQARGRPAHAKPAYGRACPSRPRRGVIAPTRGHSADRGRSSRQETTASVNARLVLIPSERGRLSEPPVAENAFSSTPFQGPCQALVRWLEFASELASLLVVCNHPGSVTIAGSNKPYALRKPGSAKRDLMHARSQPQKKLQAVLIRVNAVGQCLLPR